MNRYVSPGEKTRGKSNARDFNTLRDVARDYRDSRLGQLSGDGLGRNGIMPATFVRAYRDATAETLPATTPVRLYWEDGDLGADVGTDADQVLPHPFMLNPTVRADSPERGDAGRAVGIAAETIEAGRVGLVYVSGVCLAKVNVLNTNHEFASLFRDNAYLTSGVSGTCRILWKPETAEGLLLCLVLLNAGGGGGAGDSFWGVITGDDGQDEPDTLYSWAESGVSGSIVEGGATGTENLRRARSNGIPPKIPTGQVVRIWPGAEDGEFECPAAGGIQSVQFYTKEYVWDSSTCVMTTHTYVETITGRDLKIATRVEV